MTKQTIIVVDDDRLVNDSLKLALESMDYNVIACFDDREYFQALDTSTADLILLDVHLGAVNGIDLLENTRARGILTPVMIITGYGDVPMAVRTMKLGAEDFLLKPVSLEQLEVAVQKVLQRASINREVERLREQVKATEGGRRILGNSTLMRQALSLAKSYAASDETTVLLSGESGTGKELFAKYIHDNSPRANEAFITVDCGSIPKELAENELFGHEKGAFTGATEKLKKGRFELAQRGTIFLDEIGELPLDMQVKLLRVLENRRFFRLGGTHEYEADVRVIAATNRDLAVESRKGTFRQDLFYRLNVGAITLPPLRDRKDDIAELAVAYMDEFNIKLRKQVRNISPEALLLLQQYPWPGNVRELRNIMERTMLVSTSPEITEKQLGMVIGKSDAMPSTNHSGDAYNLTIPAEGISIHKVERDLFEQTLRITNGNQLKAAKLLGLTRAKFRYRLEQLGLEAAAKAD